MSSTYANVNLVLGLDFMLCVPDFRTGLLFTYTFHYV